MDNILEDFFLQSTERKLNKNLLYCKYEQEIIKNYISMLLQTPLADFVHYIKFNFEKQVITSKDVVQFSDFNDATIHICSKLNEVDNPGLKFLEIGKLLLDDGKVRKDEAYIKYGENHAKTARTLGLVFEFYNTYYLSCVGLEFLKMESDDLKKLLDRLIVRSPLISRMLQASLNGRVNMREFLYMISYSTYIRRKSNMKKVVDYLYTSSEYDFGPFIECIEF